MNTEKKVYLHIGAPKTGSSAIQYFLLNNSKQLNRDGFCYPGHNLDENNISSGNGHKILIKYKREGLDEAKKFLQNIIDRCKMNKILFSAESFYEVPEVIYELFPNAKIIVYFREQSSFFESSYNQGVKRSFLTISFEDYVKRKLNAPEEKSYHYKLMKWGKIYGYDNITLRPYDKTQFIGGTIYSDFLHCLGIKINNNYSIKNNYINVSYNRDALEFKLLLNKLMSNNKNLEINKYIDTALQKYSQESYNNSEERYRLLNAQTKSLIIQHYQDINKQILKSFLNDTDILFNNLETNPDEDTNYHGIKPDVIINLCKFIIDIYPETLDYLCKQIYCGLYSDDEEILSASVNLLPVFSITEMYNYISKNHQTIMKGISNVK